METPQSVLASSSDGLPGPAPRSCYSADLEWDLVSPAAAEPRTCGTAGTPNKTPMDLRTAIINACGVQLKQHGGPIQFLEQRYGTNESLATYCTQLYKICPMMR